jgi:hypothetical protein
MGMLNMNMNFFLRSIWLNATINEKLIFMRQRQPQDYCQQFKILEFMNKAPDILDLTFLCKP